MQHYFTRWHLLLFSHFLGTYALNKYRLRLDYRFPKNLRNSDFQGNIYRPYLYWHFILFSPAFRVTFQYKLKKVSKQVVGIANIVFWSLNLTSPGRKKVCMGLYYFFCKAIYIDICSYQLDTQIMIFFFHKVVQMELLNTSRLNTLQNCSNFLQNLFTNLL